MEIYSKLVEIYSKLVKIYSKLVELYFINKVYPGSLVAAGNDDAGL